MCQEFKEWESRNTRCIEIILMDIFPTGVHGVARCTERHFPVRKHMTCWVKGKATEEATRKVNCKEIK